MLDIKVGLLLPAVSIGPLCAAKTRLYAEASGDRNPIHLQDRAAQAVGLSGAAVHGMQLAAFMHAMVQRWRPRFVIKRFSTRFLAPVLVGETVEISGRVVEVNSTDFVVRLFLRNSQGSLAVLGEATIERNLP